MFPGLTDQHPKMHLDQFSYFSQLTAESPYTLQCALNGINVRLTLKLIAAINAIKKN